ncbi:MAG: M14 family zinc carboxypeptidase [Saprospiraceae bacterium]
MRSTSIVFFLLLSFIGALSAQITTPQDFFADYSKSFTAHHQLIEYFEDVADKSPRVSIQQYGTTYEGRPLMLAFISSEATIAELEDARNNHLKRSQVIDGEAGGTAKAVVWLSCSVHGNEVAGSEASPQILYDLASAPARGSTDKTGDSLAIYLENTIVILDPSLNPDGYTRYTDDQRRRATRWPDASPSAWEHYEGWPNGRTNHYQFDLNRDWAWATQKETQARLKVYHAWMPHVHVDLHEMGANSSYYFAPAAEPYHAYLTDFQRSFQKTIGQNHARVFDKKGWMYYTGEVFDLLYPSYGDTYPMFNGSIGMTYEQGGSGFAGRALKRNEGDTLTLADRMAHHHATSLSTIAVASRNAEALVAATADYRNAAKTKARGAYESYVFPKGENSIGRLTSLTDLLDTHQITYGTATSKSESAGKAYGASKAKSFTINKGDLVVPARQLQGVLAQVLLDPVATVADSLTYDITAWSLPSVLGIKGFAAKNQVKDLRQIIKGSFSGPNPLPAYGFAIPVDALNTWTKLAPEIKNGLVARYSTFETKLDDHSFAPGTLFILARDQKGSSSAYAKTHGTLLSKGIEITPLSGGMASKGKDLGSNDVTRIDAPNVVLVQDDALDVNAFGHVWHFFEQRLQYPIRPVPWSRLNTRALADVDVVIITQGRLDLSGSNTEALRSWIKAGGRLIVMEDSAEQFGRLDGFALSEKEKPAKLIIGNGGVDPMRPFASRERESAASNTPGALVAAQIDLTHPLAYGLNSDFFVLRADRRTWDFLENGYNVIGIRENPEIRGFVGSEVQDELEETLSLGVQPMGRGDVIYAADNLAYRGFWENGMQILTNAVFYR